MERGRSQRQPQQIEREERAQDRLEAYADPEGVRRGQRTCSTSSPACAPLTLSTVAQVFAKFDQDGNGVIDFEEARDVSPGGCAAARCAPDQRRAAPPPPQFREMLPHFGIHLKCENGGNNAA